MTRRGRPRESFGSISAAVLSLAAARPVTSLDVARELQVSRIQARTTVSRLRSIGQLQVHSFVTVVGSNKPLRQVVAAQGGHVGQAVQSLSGWAHAVRQAVEVEA